MSLAVLNINDAGIQVSLDGDLVRTSPGFAVLNNGDLMVGEEAADHARLLPRWTNNRFWSQLNTTPLTSGSSQIRHHADLAFAHLENLWQPLKGQADSVIFVVPGYYENDNLGLLLGMSRECGLPVSGVVDHSVVAAANLPLHRTVLHLDIHLHAITLTKLSNAGGHQGGTLVRREVKTVIETGLATLWDRWATIISEQFIQATRFDPMHQANSEQALFNTLPTWITSLGQNNAHPFSLDTGNTEHNITISNENLLKAVTPIYPQVVQAIRAEVPQGETVSLLLSHRFQGFPGLKDSLSLIGGIDIVDLQDLKVVGSATLHRDKIISDSSAISHIIQLDAGELNQEETPGTRPKVSHLLWQHQAFPVGRGITLGEDLSQGPRQSDNPICSIYTRNDAVVLDIARENRVQLNGSAESGIHPLEPGDIITIGDEQLTCVAVHG